LHAAAVALVGLASLSLQAEDFELALDYLDRSFALSRELAFTEGKGHALFAVAAVRALQGDRMAAIDLYMRAALLYQRTGDVDSLGKVYNNLGVLRYLDGYHVVAIPLLELGLDFVSAMADIVVVINALANNILTYESHYFQRASIYRDAVAGLARELPPGLSRAADGTLAFVGSVATTRRPGTYTADLVIPQSTLFLQVPSLVSDHSYRRGGLATSPAERS
jgi:tetratricopeptide (TPR) repeat protein